MKEITASMAGTVWQVLVSEGEAVSEGQTVIILESMKMEIPVDATDGGTVESVKFASGDFVNEGDVLVTLK
ncbi:acetyl-CoA carboxylase biotin carboxyl carrier protein subunit [Fictibacillus phosphorivorans]|uniref:Acetyl-CoA carboxylase biotin carboxyl carrier protein subunit n=1 Tax=Fictibacillus phosphorivorans TaxID=1221500 RepID=A0A165NES4_9BACL|nr:acetyl-CoA carboxylase biotin carboxyl carrier protein subunit [Fictibacillus phosphorivorans]KZE65770.1 acetyl-CoA carboxylase biotin carboxyl carrier protein subunit [Fictibacillus phosphorivorans]